MLLKPLIWSPAVVLLFLSLDSRGQVALDVPLHFGGSADHTRIEGLAYPTRDDGAITVEVAASGSVLWGMATVLADTLLISMSPTNTEIRDGLLVRFIPTAVNPGPVWIRLDGSASYPLLRTDALPVVRGELSPTTVVEMIHTDGVWTYLNASHDRCPPGTIAVNARLCIDQMQTPGLLYYAAVRTCGARGAKLCSWGEYLAACTLVGSALTGLFDEWEWLDDTANHTHTALQAGRLTCQSQRSANAISIITGDTRCCYHIR